LKIHPAFLASTYLPVKPSLFLFESNKIVLEYLKRMVGKQYAVHAFTDARCFLEKLGSEPSPGLVVLSWEGADATLPIFSELRASHSDIPVVVLSCTDQVSDYQHFVRLGATEVLLKPLLNGDLEAALSKLLPSLQIDSKYATEIPLDEDRSFVRSSKRMREIEGQAKLVASSDIPVLILGESGTGKEVLAMYTHKMSRRSKKMFMKINCAAMPAELLESELFGYEQGAFTGAAKMKPGKFETCDGGTIFLDEIGEMPAILQAKLLQVLQDGTFSRLGGRTSMRVDVRIIAATNVNMKQAMAEKSFREDLYYRLNGISLVLPPLRERTEEIPSLVSYFMRKGAAKYGLRPMSISSELMTLFSEFPWPGNLRELENVINRLLVMQDEKSIVEEVTLRPASGISADRAAAVGNAPHLGGLKEMVRDLKGEAESVAITHVLEAKGWNRRAAASSLQISYKALLYKIKQYDLAPGSMKRSYQSNMSGQALHA
jgi:two-component system response regulator AtoC